MNRSRTQTAAAVLMASCGVLFSVAPAAAQSSGSTPPSKTKVVRRPVVDLKKQAEEPRPGQVQPGQPQPQPEPDQPAAEEPAPKPEQPAAPQRPAVDIPDTTAQPAAAQPAKPIKPAPVPVQVPEPARQPAPAATAQPSQPPPAPEPAPVARVRPEPDPLPELRTDRPAPQPEPAASPRAVPPAPAPQAEPASEPAPATEPARVGSTALARPGESVSARIASIEGPPDVIEWRGLGEDWAAIAAGATASGRLEVRTGLGAAATFVLDDQVEVKVLRLSRVRFERREPSGPGMPAEIVVEIQRGEVDIKPKQTLIAGAATAVIRIITPDKNFATRLPTGVRYDAFSGTRTTVVSLERQR